MSITHKKGSVLTTLRVLCLVPLGEPCFKEHFDGLKLSPLEKLLIMMLFYIQVVGELCKNGNGFLIDLIYTHTVFI